MDVPYLRAIGFDFQTLDVGKMARSEHRCLVTEEV